MAKRRKRERDPRERGDPVIEQAMLEVTEEYADRAPWIDEDGPDAPWYDALAKLDKTGDKTPLIELLQSEQELTPAIRGHVADLLNRYTLKRKRGKQATPSYVLSGPNTRLWWLKFLIQNSHRDMSIGEVAEQLATDEFPVETLLAAYHGKHGGFARAMRKKK